MSLDLKKTDFSQVVTALRFPLAVMVVLWHTPPTVDLSMDLPIYSQGFAAFFYYLLSCTLTYVSVPAFYFISGYYFFKGMKDWNWYTYGEKLKKRVRTLFVPYVLWIIIFLILVSLLLFTLISQPLGEWGGQIICFLDEHGWLRIFWDNNRLGENPAKLNNIIGVPMHHMYPLMSSMWYLRDLMIVCLLSPLVYFIVRRAQKVGLVVMAVLMCLNIWIPIEGFSATAFFFFMWGAYMRVNSIDIIDTFKRRENVCFFVTILAVLLRLYFYSVNSIVSSIFAGIYMIFGIICIFNITNRLLQTKEIKIHDTLSESSFFIYCSHLVVKPFVWIIISRLLLGESDIIASLKYFLVMISMVLCSLGIYVIMKKICPRALSLLNGGR